MGQNVVPMVISLLGEFYIFMVLLRFLLQMSQADFYNPISQAVARLTNYPVAPLRAIVPKVGRFDFSALVLAILLQIALYVLLLFIITGGFQPLATVLVAVVKVFSSILDIYFYAVIGAVIISWIAPGSYHPAPQLILQLTEPVFNVARKIIPPFSGLDLSPILIFIVIQVIQWTIKPMIPF